MKKINSDIVQNLLVAMPEEEERQLILSHLLTISRRIELENMLLEKYNQIKLGLVTDLLTGQKRVPQPPAADVEVTA